MSPEPAVGIAANVKCMQANGFHGRLANAGTINRESGFSFHTKSHSFDKTARMFRGKILVCMICGRFRKQSWGESKKHVESLSKSNGKSCELH